MDLTTFSPTPAKANVKVNEISKLPEGSSILVAGAGVFGSWSALSLLRKGFKVTLCDPQGPGNSLSSSGGESRLIRAIYGDSIKYFQMTIEALQHWKDLERASGYKVLYQTGVLWMFRKGFESLRSSLEDNMKERKWPFETIPQSLIQDRFNALNASDIDRIIQEKMAGYIQARYACKVVVDQFVKEGGIYEKMAILPGRIQSNRLTAKSNTGNSISAYDLIVFASGPWLRSLFPDVFKNKLRVTRQEVHYFAIPQAKAADFASLLPWVDWDDDNFFYGIPDYDGRGFKIACDRRGAEVDPDTMDRIPDKEWVKHSRSYLRHRFPLLANSPLIESRICQYSTTVDGNFIVDVHPEADNVWLVGGGSGHGFKHGPIVGQLVADIATGQRSLDPDFILTR